MGTAISVRAGTMRDQDLRRLAARVRDAGQARRLLAIAAVLDFTSRKEAAKIGGMDRQTLRDWVIRFNDQGPDGLINEASPGAPGKLTQKNERAFLARLVEEGQVPAVHGVVRWRACDLIMRLYEEFGLSVSDDTIYRALKDLGFSHVSARPRAYKTGPRSYGGVQKNFPARVAEVRAKLAPGTAIEVWCQDEMRVGQKNKLTYRWARKTGSRPRAVHDQRTQSSYLFGAVCPELGTGAALVLPACNSEAMQLHLDEIATKVSAETLRVLDPATTNAVNLSGNEIANILIGNAGANALNGRRRRHHAGAGRKRHLCCRHVQRQGLRVAQPGHRHRVHEGELRPGCQQSVETLRVLDPSDDQRDQSHRQPAQQHHHGNNGVNVINGGGGADTCAAWTETTSIWSITPPTGCSKPQNQGTDTVRTQCELYAGIGPVD